MLEALVAKDAPIPVQVGSPSLPDPVAAPDSGLVDAARAGDAAAFEQLVLRYQDRVFHLCFRKLGSREDALETSQEVFLRAWRAIPRFHGRSRFYTWLFRIALNCAFSRRKRRARRRGLFPVSLGQDDACGESAAPEPATRAPGPLGETLRHEQAERIAEAISQLPELYHHIVLLRDVEGMSYEEISETLDLPLGSVKSRLHRARLQLRELLADLWADL
jgi:RNA polymerase sigma-70 factor (ECF subfamily)